MYRTWAAEEHRDWLVLEVEGSLQVRVRLRLWFVIAWPPALFGILSAVAGFRAGAGYSPSAPSSMSSQILAPRLLCHRSGRSSTPSPPS